MFGAILGDFEGDFGGDIGRDLGVQKNRITLNIIVECAITVAIFF